MAHHHHRSCHTTAVCCCTSSCCSGASVPQPQQSPLTDPLLQALAAHLLQLQPPQTQTHSQTTVYSHPLKPQLHSAPPHHRHHQQKHRFQQLQEQPQQTHSAVATLLRRIDTLEASLAQFQSSPSSHSSGSSLREVAARVIQTHFRAFLVRRSRTLRQLKDLAFIKSGLNALKSSVSDQTHFDFEAISHKAMDLLLKLDSIQGGDPMIRDGRRSISKELVRFTEFLDRVSVKRMEISVRATKSMRFGQSYRKSLREPGREVQRISRVCEIDEEDDEGHEGFDGASDDEDYPDAYINGSIKKQGLAEARNGGLVKRPGVQPKVKKTVSFADTDGHLPRELHRFPESIGNEEGVCIDDQIERVENLCRKLEAASGLARVVGDDGEGSSQNSDIDRNSLRSSSNGANDMIRGHGDDDLYNEFLFSAPLPVKMEARDDIVNKRKTLRIDT